MSKNKILNGATFKWTNITAWHVFFLFFFINLIQGFFTPLLNDEPYYWVYAQKLSWGYFDHPPMIAWLIALGSSILNGEIGVRILPAFLGSFTLFFLYKIIENESEKLMKPGVILILLSSSVFLNLYSFLAIPDTPLLFFSTFLLWQYQRFLKNETIINSLLLGLFAALLLYSKYHGVLVIGFIVVSNLKLLKKPLFYIALLFSLVLFSPHIFWQFSNDFQTIRFHLSDKGNEFRIDRVFSYLGEQLILAGPIILILFTILKKATNQFQRSLKYVSLGVLIFFFVASFRGMVNAYWTIIAWPGLIFFSYQYISQMFNYRKLIYVLLFLNLTLVLVMRIDFLFNFFPIRNFNDRNPIELVEKLKENNAPLVFENMFIEPSYYWFYTEQSSFAINNISYKKTQFNYLNDCESAVQNKNITFVSRDSINEKSKLISIPKGKKYYLTHIDNFISFQTTWAIKAEGIQNGTSGTLLNLQLTPISFEKNTNKVFLSFNMQNQLTNQRHKIEMDTTLISGKPIELEVILPEQTGTYKCYFSISNDTVSYLKTYQSNIYMLHVTSDN